MILESCDTPSAGGESLDRAVEDAVRGLISGDLDDPPLSEETVEEMLSQ
jgi:hypothetical protein